MFSSRRDDESPVNVAVSSGRGGDPVARLVLGVAGSVCEVAGTNDSGPPATPMTVLDERLLVADDDEVEPQQRQRPPWQQATSPVGRPVAPSRAQSTDAACSCFGSQAETLDTEDDVGAGADDVLTANEEVISDVTLDVAAEGCVEPFVDEAMAIEEACEEGMDELGGGCVELIELFEVEGEVEDVSDEGGTELGGELPPQHVHIPPTQHACEPGIVRSQSWMTCASQALDAEDSDELAEETDERTEEADHDDVVEDSLDAG